MAFGPLETAVPTTWFPCATVKVTPAMTPSSSSCMPLLLVSAKALTQMTPPGTGVSVAVAVGSGVAVGSSGVSVSSGAVVAVGWAGGGCVLVTGGGGGWVGCGGGVFVGGGPTSTSCAPSNQTSRWARQLLAPCRSAETKTVTWLPVAVASTENCCQLLWSPASWGDPAPPQTTSLSLHRPLPLGSIPARMPRFTAVSDGVGNCSLEARPMAEKVKR